MWPSVSDLFFRKKTADKTADKPASKSSGRSFAAAGGGRLLDSIGEMFGSYNQANRQSLATIRRRSRQAAIDDPYISRFLKLCEQNIIGEGARLFATNGNPGLEEAIEGWWKRWCDECDITGKNDFTAIASLAVRSTARDGEFLVLPLVTDQGLRLQSLDVSRLDDGFNDINAGIRQGVEINGVGAPVAYHLLTAVPNDMSAIAKQHRVRTPADNAMHGFVPLWEEQVRGLPWLHSSLLWLHHINRYNEAAVVAARLGAAKSIFFTQSENAPDAIDASDIPTEIAPAMAPLLPQGVNMEAFDPSYPHSQYNDFLKAAIRGIATGLNVTYGGISGDLSDANYSSMRAGSVMERDTWMTLQRHFNRQFHRKIFLQALKTDLLRGAIAYRGQALSIGDFAKLSQHQFQFRRWDWVDPKADLDAELQAMSRGIRSPYDVAAKYGTDIEANLADLARLQSKCQDLGINVDWTSASKTARAIEPTAPTDPTNTNNGAQHDNSQPQS